MVVQKTQTIDFERQGIFYHLCMAIDIMVPVAFTFFTEHFDIMAHSSFFHEGWIIGPTFIACLLIFPIYAMVAGRHFPKDTFGGLWQLVLRLGVFGFLYFTAVDVSISLFMYGLFDVVSLALIMAVYLIFHPLFINKSAVGPYGGFTHDKLTIFVALLFGIPLLIWGVAMFTSGYEYLAADMISFEGVLRVVVWIAILLPLLFAHFRSLREYSTDYYS